MAIETNIIQRIEERSLNAWAAPRSMLLDGWVLRFADGYTKRANSVNVLYAGNQPITEKIKVCRELYTQQAQPLIFRVSPLAPAELDRQLANLGFSQFDFVSVQIKDLSKFEIVRVEQLEITYLYWKWINYFHLVHPETAFKDLKLLEKILDAIVPAKAFGVLQQDNEPVAIGLAVLEGDDVGLFEISTRAAYRRQGYAELLILGLLSWAK